VLDAPRLDLQIEDSFPPLAKIRIFGVGGGGGNALTRMMAARMDGVEFVFANTDLQALNRCPSTQRLQLGEKITGGLGAGANPEVGQKAALEDTNRIIDALQGLDMVFVAAGLGGGTGTGAAPVISALARELGVLSVAIVTLPFGFEGARRMRQAELGLEELYNCADAVVVIRNDRLLETDDRGVSLVSAFSRVDDLMRDAVWSVTDLVSDSGLINLDFADLRTTMTGMGSAVMGTGRASGAAGEGRATSAAWAAINSPLLDNNSIEGARNVVISVAGGSDLTLHEASEAATVIHDLVDENASIIFGTTLDESMNETVRVTVIANGQEHRPVVATPPRSPEDRPTFPLDERISHEPAYLRRRALG
jgi:cell division protein FtsZ